jgi:hypothetical protein
MVPVVALTKVGATAFEADERFRAQAPPPPTTTIMASVSPTIIGRRPLRVSALNRTSVPLV